MGHFWNEYILDVILVLKYHYSTVGYKCSAKQNFKVLFKPFIFMVSVSSFPSFSPALLPFPSHPLGLTFLIDFTHWFPTMLWSQHNTSPPDDTFTLFPPFLCVTGIASHFSQRRRVTEARDQCPRLSWHPWLAETSKHERTVRISLPPDKFVIPLSNKAPAHDHLGAI